MSWIAAAIVASAAIGAGSAYLSGKAGSSAAESASQTSAAATKYAADLQYKLGEEALGLEKPFYESAYRLLPSAEAAGLAAYKEYPEMLAMATDYKTSPLTQLQLQGTTDQLNNALAARGLYNSGAGMQAISGATQNIMANQEQNQWNRLTQLYGLGTGTTTMNMGGQAAANAAGTASNLGTGLANTYMQGAGIQAQAQLSAGQSTANMYQNMGGLAMGLGQGALYSQGLQGGTNSTWQSLYGGSFDPYTGMPLS